MRERMFDACAQFSPKKEVMNHLQTADIYCHAPLCAVD
jgi:hypothetical protein